MTSRSMARCQWTLRFVSVALSSCLLVEAFIPISFPAQGPSCWNVGNQGTYQWQSRKQLSLSSLEIEAQSHSETTLQLTPSYELFQLLPEQEGGKVPATSTGNENQDGATLKLGTMDTLDGIQLSSFVGCGGTMGVDSLPDPFQLVKQEMKPFSSSMQELVTTDQPLLFQAANHFFEKRHGKRVRPSIVHLLSKAVAAVHPDRDLSVGDGQRGDTTREQDMSEVRRRQGQLSQIVEMIHVASLIHDDVVDKADTRRGGEAVHKMYSNKVAVLAGDFLLARASLLLARLENSAVVQIVATALESLVAGELMQLSSPPEDLVEMEYYLRKSYYKTASLIGYSCRATALLGGYEYESTVATASEEYGFHLGLAFQIQDDILDFTASASLLGKPTLVDMDLGLSTAPVLYAAQEVPELKPLIQRRFQREGDKETVLQVLQASETAMDKAKALALFHAQRAVDAILRLPQSQARDALIRLTHTVITRNK